MGQARLYPHDLGGREFSRVTGLPVFSIYSFITWFQSALQPRAGF